MSTKRIVISMLAVAFLILNFQSCYKVTTIIEGGSEITGEVSLAKDILPILNNSCNTSGCHNSGGIKPDLSESSAFNSLNNGGYINLNNPEESEVYLWLTGNRSTAMPPGGPVNPSNLNQLIIAWIKQGASNN